MSNGTVVRDAHESDASAISQIGAATFTSMFGHSLPAEHLQAYLEQSYATAAILAEITNKAQNKFFVAVSVPSDLTGPGQIVGFAQVKLRTTEPCLDPSLPVCEVHRIYVSTDHHGQGTGRTMMEQALRWVSNALLGPERFDAALTSAERAEEGAAGAWLGVWEDNPKAIRFYQSFSFSSVGSHDFVMGDTVQTDLVMLRWL